MKFFTGKLFQHLAQLVAAALFVLTSTAGAAEPLSVVASFSILGDFVQRVGGERVQVHTLVGRDADAHVYQPTPADAKALALSRLVIVNGFGFEGWIDRLVKSSGYRGEVLIAARGIRVLKMPHASEKGQDHHLDHAGDVDPHAWQDLSNAVRYVDNILQSLSQIDPEGKAFYQANASKFKQEITLLDSEIRKTFNAIPKERRKVVTSHDAFGYFGRAYGIRFISPVGISTDAEPSAADVARIIQQIRREKIPAVFIESISDTRLLERIRQESGASIGGTLYSDSLSGSNGPAQTYLDLMRHNAQELATALGK